MYIQAYGYSDSGSTLVLDVFCVLKIKIKKGLGMRVLRVTEQK